MLLRLPIYASIEDKEDIRLGFKTLKIIEMSSPAPELEILAFSSIYLKFKYIAQARLPSPDLCFKI